MSGEPRHDMFSLGLTPGQAEMCRLLVNLYLIKAPESLDSGIKMGRECQKTALALGWAPEEVKSAFLAGLFHDVGYLVPPPEPDRDAEEEKPQPLRPERDHTVWGARLLDGIPSLAQVRLGVKYHHEKHNGSGFPDELTGEEIPLIARLLNVVHSYWELVHGYGNSPPMAEAEARLVLQEDAGILLDREITKVYLSTLPPSGGEARSPWEIDY